MNRQLFFGPEAVDSILPIAEATNARLIQMAHQSGNAKVSRYSPWMAVPQTMLTKPLSTNWIPDTRTFQVVESSQIKEILSAIQQNVDQIPSHEGYSLGVSTMSASETENFNSRIQESEQKLCATLPHFRILLDRLIHKYIPMESTTNNQGDFGMSTLWFKGAIFFEKNQKPELDQRVENLAHEIAHQIILHYQLNDPLIEGDLNAPVYSGIRQENRPAILSFHGAAALSYMLWIQTHLKNESRCKEIQKQLESTLMDLGKTQFTIIGKKIFEEFHTPLVQKTA
jgi:hypothetical protein